MKTKDDLQIDDLRLPNIPVKIIRQGDQIKLTAGDYSIELKCIDGYSQTYPLLVLEKFVREVTTKLLKEEIDRRENREAVKKSLTQLGVDPAQETDRVIQAIHEHEFGGDE